MLSKPLKAIGEKSGKLKKMLGAEISREISETHDIKFDEQMAIAMNALEAIFEALKQITGEDFRPTDFKNYEILRAQVKENVNKE